MNNKPVHNRVFPERGSVYDRNFSGINASVQRNPRYIDPISPKEVLNICTVSFNQNECIQSLHHSLSITCKLPWKMHVIDNGSIPSNLVSLREFCKNSNINLLERICRYTMSRASEAHGDALDFAMEKVGNENSIMTIVDSDFFFVKNGWDAMLRDILPKFGHITTMRNFNVHHPAAFMSMFRKKIIKSKKISFMPIVGKNGKAIKISGQDGKKVNYHDVGYQLSKIQMSRWQKLRNIPIEIYHNPITSIEGSCDIHLQNFPIASHLSRGRIGRRRSEVYTQWIEQCTKFREQN
jgi:hypothetical protein